MKFASFSLRRALGGYWKAENVPAERSREMTVFYRFAADSRGDVAILFGLMTLVLVMLIGLAVDYGRLVNARSQTLEATDAAVLAGARALQTNGGDQAGAIKVAQAYYKQAVQNRISVVSNSDTINFAVTDNGTAVVSQGNAQISTPFMSVAGVKTLPLLHANGSDYAKAVLAVGGNAELNLEVSLMLDISGSMGAGTKLEDMKAAANDLVDIVIWKDQSKYTSRVAIVPFSSDVLPTDSLFQYATGQANTTTPSSVTISGSSTKYYPTKCVAERGGKDYTDTAPSAGHYVLREFTTNSTKNAKTGPCGINSNGTVVPMTSDKTVLHDKINSLVDGGNTAGHVGTAWTYYMLSPKWAPGLPSGSKPVAYGTANTKKIAILMTDGEYNMEHESNGAPSPSNSNGVNGIDSPSQAKKICADMKTLAKANDPTSANIEIYTVGFQLGNNKTAIDTLSACATDANHFYNSTTGDALKAAFRDIALKISTLYLSQ